MKSVVEFPNYSQGQAHGGEESLHPRHFGRWGLNTVQLTGRKATLTPVEFPTTKDHHRLILTLQGTAGISFADGNPVVLSKGSLAFMPAGTVASMFLGREDHDCIVASVESSRFEGLGLSPVAAQRFAFHLDRSAAPLYMVANRLHKALRRAEDETELVPLVVSVLALAFHFRSGSSPPETLADIPADLQDVLTSLLLDVKADPSRPWGLKEAAESASYSAFHLSRTFRNVAHYGFPEFVDRCRAEMACRFLIESSIPYDDLVGMCGFGSSQGMRTAVREYYGFLPSEIRGLTKA